MAKRSGRADDGSTGAKEAPPTSTNRGPARRAAGVGSAAADGSRRADPWSDFEARLAVAIERMPVESFLILTTPSAAAGPASYVQFAHFIDEKDHTTALRAEAVCSENRPGAPLAPEQEEQLVAGLGWGRPQPDDVSRNFVRTWEDPPPVADVARLAVRTLREVFGLETPASLRWVHELFDRGQVTDPDLGIEPDRPARRKSGRRRIPSSIEELIPLVEKALNGGRGRRSVFRDADGDFPVEIGSTVIYIRPLEGTPPVVQLFGPILHDIGESRALISALNDINARVRFGRVFFAHRQVVAAMELTAVDITVEQIAFAIAELGNLADHLDDTLQARFGGSTTFPTRPGLVN